jgi:hypothetical protein
MTKPSMLAIAIVMMAAHGTPALAKPVHRGTGHHAYHAQFHHHAVPRARSPYGAFGAVSVPRYFGLDPNSPAATGGGSLGYNRGIYAN